ncbi:hypothetical protein R5R35_011987 [Gryllus longicercus]|uniref:Uncharacterized protein n=1 Tax=Gryllus longicercus TaxID=2509291 RepID=A0AAN9VUE9_9ORTH
MERRGGRFGRGGARGAVACRAAAVDVAAPGLAAWRGAALLSAAVPYCRPPPAPPPQPLPALSPRAKNAPWHRTNRTRWHAPTRDTGRPRRAHAASPSSTIQCRNNLIQCEQLANDSV